MTRFLIFTLVCEAGFFVALLSFLGRPSPIAQLLLMPLGMMVFVLWLVTRVKVFMEKVPSKRINTLAVFLAVPLLFVAVVFSAGLLRSYLFGRDLPQMQAVVNQLKAGTLQTKRGRVQLPVQHSSLAYLVSDRKSAGGVWTVEFFVGGGFPVKHHAYLYKSDDKITVADERNWPSGVRRAPCWFECSD